MKNLFTLFLIPLTIGFFLDFTFEPISVNTNKYTMYWLNQHSLLPTPLSLTPQNVTAMYLYESFEGTWSGTPAAPSGWNQTIVAVGGGSGSAINWAKNTWSGSAWSSNCYGSPTGAQTGSSVAWFIDFDCYPDRVMRLASGDINLSTSSSPTLYFYYAASTSATFTLKVRASSNGGVNWNDISTPTKPGTTWTLNTISLTAAYKVSNARIAFEITSTSGSYDAYIDNVIVSEPPTPMIGTKTIKSSGGDYSTFTAAINDLNFNGVGSGGITFNVDPGFTSTELCPIITATGSSGNPIIFQKSGSGLNPKITAGTGIGTADAIIRINGGDYITFDGIDVSEAAGNVTTNSQMEYGYYLYNASATNGSQYNTIKNSKITLNRTNTSSIGVYQTYITSPTNATGANSYNKYYNLTVENAYNGIYLLGISGYPDLSAEIGTTGTGQTTIGSSSVNDIGNGSYTTWGIRATQQQDIKIFSCEVRNVTQTGSSNHAHGIFLDGLKGTANKIYNNNIHDIKGSSTSNGSTITGIRADAASGVVINIYNNFVCAISHASTTASSTQYIRGISCNIVGTGTVNAYYNSIRLETSQYLSSSAFYIQSGNANAINNIFSNFSATNATSKRYCIYNSSGTLTTSNYNDLYINTGGTNNFTGYNGSADKITLANWQTATGQDAYSVIGDPGFSSTTNLIPNVANSNSWVLSGNAIHLASVTTDYAGTLRPADVSAGAPDIGAYEFTASESSSTPNTFSITPGPGVNDVFVNGRKLISLNFTALGGIISIGVQFYSGVPPPRRDNYPSAQFMNGYFVVTPTGGSSFTYDITYYYSEPQRGTITNEDYIRLSKNDGNLIWTAYTDLGTAPGQYQINTTLNTIDVFGLNSFSTFSNSDKNAPLPVQLATFTSSINGRDVILNWKTDKEINNSGFEIERAEVRGQKSEEWTKVTFVTGNGTKNTPTDYSFNDKKLNAGKYNYRLKQIDYNGNFEYHNLSATVEIGVPKKFEISQNYPNPFNPVTKIDFDLPFDSKVSIRLYDITGREIKTLINETKQAGYYTTEFNGSNISSGTYFYRIVAEGNGQNFVMTKKMLMIK